MSRPSTKTTWEFMKALPLSRPFIVMMLALLYALDLVFELASSSVLLNDMMVLPYLNISQDLNWIVGVCQMQILSEIGQPTYCKEILANFVVLYWTAADFKYPVILGRFCWRWRRLLAQQKDALCLTAHICMICGELNDILSLTDLLKKVFCHFFF